MFAPNFWKMLVLSTFAIFVAGCTATTEVMPDAADAEAEKFMPKEKLANIYVVREDAFMGSGVLLQVHFDGKLQGGIAPGTYMLFEVAEGKHTVTVMTAENTDSVKINALQGNNYFVEVTPVMGWMAARADVEVIEAERGKNIVLDGERVELISY